MVMAWWMGLALAGPGVTFVSATPFELTQPEAWSLAEGAPVVSEGWLLEVRADPAQLQSRQARESVIYAGTTPVRRLNSDPVGGCAVLLVPGRVALDQQPVFVGPAELPERITPEMAKAAEAEALKAGATPLTAAQLAAVITPKLSVKGLEEVFTAGQTLVAACQPDRPTPPTND